MNSNRVRYAIEFNTLPVHVKYWHELDDRQRELAVARFSAIDMAGHVYCLGLDESVIARRRLEVQR